MEYLLFWSHLLTSKIQKFNVKNDKKQNTVINVIAWTEGFYNANERVVFYQRMIRKKNTRASIQAYFLTSVVRLYFFT